MNTVTYEVAELAYLLGFEYNTLGYYWIGESKEPDNIDIGDLGSHEMCYREAKFRYKNHDIMPAPTQEELLEWLWHVHNSWLSAIPQVDKTWVCETHTLNKVNKIEAPTRMNAIELGLHHILTMLFNIK